MNTRNAMAQYRSVQSRGAVIDASPTRLIQLAFEQVLAQLTVARGCMERINKGRQVRDVVDKGTAISKVNALLGELAGSLDLERGEEIAKNLLALYSYMMTRLTVANMNNDALIIDEVSKLVREIKSGWDEIVAAGVPAAGVPAAGVPAAGGE
jgi:flagellar protein FliS